VAEEEAAAVVTAAAAVAAAAAAAAAEAAALLVRFLDWLDLLGGVGGVGWGVTGPFICFSWYLCICRSFSSISGGKLSCFRADLIAENKHKIIFNFLWLIVLLKSEI